MDKEPGRLQIQSMQSQRVGHNLATKQQQYYTGKLLRVNPKSSHHKGKYFFLFFKFCYLYEMMDGH